MNKSNWRFRFQCLSLFLTILTLVITLTINAYPLYLWEVSRTDILDWVNLPRATLLENYRVLMQYLNNPFQTKLHMPNFPTSQQGALHFYEVKQLFLLNYFVLLLTIIPTFTFLKQLRQEKRRWQLIRPFQIGALLPIVLGFLLAIGFDQFFVAFHSLLFNNDAWIFNPSTDPIINALPEEYFKHCFILAFSLLEFCFLLGIVLGKKDLRKNSA